MNLKHYILENGEVKQTTLYEWAKFFENFDLRKIAKTDIISELGHIWVSTVFLGIDHNFSNEGPPLLFETMVFGLEEEFCYRTSSLEDAQDMHKTIAEALQQACSTQE